MPSFISNFKQRLRLPRMFFRRPTREEQIHGGPPLEFAKKRVKRFRNQPPAQRVSEERGIRLEERVAFLKPDDLSFEGLLNQLPFRNRPGARGPPTFPPYFQTEDRERRARMWEK